VITLGNTSTETLFNSSVSIQVLYIIHSCLSKRSSCQQMCFSLGREGSRRDTATAKENNSQRCRNTQKRKSSKLAVGQATEYT
jgi:hypothetical protein